MKQFTLIAISSLISTISFAQTDAEIARLVKQLEGTMYVVPHTETADGKLTACGLEFAAMKPDFSTKQGAPVKVVGSFYLRSHQTLNIAYAMKIGIFDGFGYENPVAPANAFVRSPTGMAPKKAIRGDAENKGFALFVGGLDDEVLDAVSAILEKKQLAIGFNRKPGQQDVTFVLDLTVADSKMGANGEIERVRSDAAVDEFARCTNYLFKTK